MSWLNDRPFKKLDGCRRSLFEELERPVMRPLPTQRYEYADWSLAKVNIDYHIEVDRHYYSVPNNDYVFHLPSKGETVVVMVNVGRAARAGEILEVTSTAGIHYRIRWDDGHETTFFQAAPASRSSRRPRGAIERARSHYGGSS